MSWKKDGPPIFMPIVRDVILRKGPTSLILKPYRILPLPVVGGGIPITRH